MLQFLLYGSTEAYGRSDAILDARTRTIDALLQLCRNLVNNYTPGVFPKRLCQGYEPVHLESQSRGLVKSSAFGSVSRNHSLFGTPPTVTLGTTPTHGFRFGTPTVTQNTTPTERFSLGVPLYAQQCDALVLGSVITGLSGAGLWPLPKDASEVCVSVFSLGQKLLNMYCHEKMDEGAHTSSHEKCIFTTTFRANVQRVLDHMDSGVLESHSLHLGEQYKKLHSYSPRI